MKKKKVVSLLLAAVCSLTGLSGCGTGGETAQSDHEPITIQSPFRNMSTFLDVLHEKYPEINLEVLPYSGKNYTAYMKDQLTSGDIPDIYCTSIYTPGVGDADKKLIDLSGYAFTDNYTEARLRDVTDNGAIYLLPMYYDYIGITYNKTILEENNWELPNSLKELEELAPKVKAAGYNLCLDQLQLPGYGFQYLCNIMDTAYLNTPDGRKWQQDYLDGKATIADTPELAEELKLLEKWRDIGMLNGNGSPDDDDDTHDMMAEGNTLFMLGNINAFTADETTDEFGLMPYLSEDGTQNAFILNVSRYIGLNKNLEQEGNEQKLEDALHVMEVLSTVEGMQSLKSTDTSNTSLLPLKDYKINPDGYYADIEDELNSGATAPFIYTGWENVIVPIGESVISFIKGERSLDAVIKDFDDAQHLLKDNSETVYTTVTEKIDTEDCARLIGICFAEAVDADLALISVNKWYKLDRDDALNTDGVSGALFPLPVTDQEITSILPTGWSDNIKTVTLTGSQVKKLAKNGYDRYNGGETFPYVLVAPEGKELYDDSTYTVVICGVTNEVAAGGKLTDTGVLGLEAAQKYFGSFDTLSPDKIIWEYER